MNTKTLGLVLAIAGILMIIYTGFNYVTTEKIVDIGPLEISGDKNNYVQWSPYVGVALLAAGLLLTFLKNKTT
ncbi:MAG: hypothetical protein KA270_08100 [Saprospiraceae bacterium]|jgi:hypothetical protein|nr:hypothetical protein [Saprospiraceae bacterium]MBP6567114.1 hypothetical protein [Saprospiraceae bacterium]